MSGIGDWFRQTVLPLLGFGPLWKEEVHSKPLVPPKKQQPGEVPRTRSSLEFDVLQARRNLMTRQTSLEGYARTRKQFAEAVRDREERRSEDKDR